MAISGPELAAKAVIVEAPIGGATPPPVDVAAGAVRANLAQKGAEAALQVAAGKAVDRGQIDYLINENVGNERDNNGKKDKLTQDEQDRQDKANKAEDLYMTLLDKGYDNLTDPQKIDARKVVLDLANSIPALQTILAGLSPAEQETYAVRMLKDPRMASFIKQGLLEQTDLTKMKANNVEQLQIEFNQLDAELTQITTESGTLDTRIKAIEKELEEYKPLTSSGAKGTTYDKMVDAQAKINAAASAATPDASALKVAQSELQQLTNEYNKVVRTGTVVSPGRDIPKISGEISTIETQIRALETNLAPRQREIQENTDLITHLKAEETALKNEKTAKETRKAEVDRNKLAKEGEKKLKEALLVKAKVDRTRYENDFVNGLDSVLSKAAEKYINERVNEAVAEGRTHLEKEAQGAVDKRAESISLGELKRWFDGNRIKADQVRLDYQELLSGGPDKIIEAILTAGGHSAADITAAMADTKFLEGARKKVATDVVKYYSLRGGWFNRGGKVHPDEIIKLGASPWGEKVIEDAAAANKTTQDQIKARFGSLPERGKWGEFIRGMDFKKLMLLLLIIFGVVGGLGIIGAKGGA